MTGLIEVAREYDMNMLEVIKIAAALKISPRDTLTDKKRSALESKIIESLHLPDEDQRKLTDFLQSTEAEDYLHQADIALTHLPTSLHERYMAFVAEYLCQQLKIGYGIAITPTFMKKTIVNCGAIKIYRTSGESNDVPPPTQLLGFDKDLAERAIMNYLLRKIQVFPLRKIEDFDRARHELRGHADYLIEAYKNESKS